MFYYIVSRNRATTTQPFHLLPLRFPPKLVLLPLKALMFKVSLEEGISPLEKVSSVDLLAKGIDVVLKGSMGGRLIKVIL